MSVSIEARQLAYKALIHLSEEQGYVTFDNIMDCADRYALPIQDFDWLSNSITTLGVIVYDNVPNQQDNSTNEEHDDFAQSDYDLVYNRIVELNPSLTSFVEAVRNITPPQRHEIQKLKYQVVEGNRFARTRMIEMHLRVAFRIALQRSETYDIDIEDAIELACIGLIMAVDKYDPDNSGAFSQYAALWILQNISREQSTQRPLVYYPVHKKEGYYTIYPILKQNGCVNCDQFFHCSKVKEIIAKYLVCDENAVADILSMAVADKSYDALIEQLDKTDCDDTDKDVLVSRIFQSNAVLDQDLIGQVEQRDFYQAMLNELKCLKPREAEVIRERYGFGSKEKTLEEVGNKMGVTRERIRQIESKAIRKLRMNRKIKKLKEYWD